jgi:hypothetical protein
VKKHVEIDIDAVTTGTRGGPDGNTIGELNEKGAFSHWGRDEAAYHTPLRSHVLSNHDILQALIDRVRGRDNSEDIYGEMIDLIGHSHDAAVNIEFSSLRSWVTDKKKP